MHGMSRSRLPGHSKSPERTACFRWAEDRFHQNAVTPSLMAVLRQFGQEWYCCGKENKSQ
jgi:hypothetical protein